MRTEKPSVNAKEFKLSKTEDYSLLILRQSQIHRRPIFCIIATGVHSLSRLHEENERSKLRLDWKAGSE